jgi:hypothetical protein
MQIVVAYQESHAQTIREMISNGVSMISRSPSSFKSRIIEMRIPLGWLRLTFFDSRPPVSGFVGGGTLGASVVI